MLEGTHVPHRNAYADNVALYRLVELSSGSMELLSYDFVPCPSQSVTLMTCSEIMPSYSYRVLEIEELQHHCSSHSMAAAER